MSTTNTPAGTPAAATSPAVTAAANATADQMRGNPPAATPAPSSSSAPAFRTPAQLAALLVVKDEPRSEPPAPKSDAPATPEPSKAAEPAAATGDATDKPGDKSADTEPAAGATDEPRPQPGTPDKVIQALQQDVAATSRKLDALLAKAESGQTLTAGEQKQVQQAQRKLDDVLARMKEGKFDAITDAAAVVEAVGEVDQENKNLRQQVAELAEQVKAINQDGRRQADAEARQALVEQYKGVDIDGVFSKALSETAESMGLDPQKLPPVDSDLGRALNNAANRLFRHRADVAAKSVAGRQPTPTKTPAPAPSPKPSPVPATPDGARITQPVPVVTNNVASSPANWREGWLERAKKLVKR